MSVRRAAFRLALDGDSLTPSLLAPASAEDAIAVAIVDQQIERVEAAHQVVLDAVRSGEPVYGLTTGLGSRVTETLSAEQVADFSLQTLRGRAHAIGEPLPKSMVRGSMIVRLNTLLKGAAGASPGLVTFLRECLSRDLIPVVGSVGSIGAGDLCLGATLGLALAGEGRMFGSNGGLVDAADGLAAKQMKPFHPGVRDGLALANHSSFSAAAMAIAVDAADTALQGCQRAAALSMSGFQANLSPLDPLASAMRPQPGQREAAGQLTALLSGASIEDIANARRLQDPLSIRNVAQTHGAAFAALEFATTAATSEINGASDNPVVDMANNRIVSCGAYHTPLLAIASQGLAQAMVHVAHTQLARISRLLSNRFTGLPQFLADPSSNDSSTSNGFAPVLKIAESLVAQITHAAAPVAVWPSVNAEGAEDIQTNTMTAVRGLQLAIDDAVSLCAIELIVGAQALDLRIAQTPGYLPGSAVLDMQQQVRDLSERLRDDRPLANDIESVANAIRGRQFTID